MRWVTFDVKEEIGYIIKIKVCDFRKYKIHLVKQFLF
jgi:hypothetical protein